MPPAPAGSASHRAGDAIALVGPFDPSLAGSELAKLRGAAPGWRAARRSTPRAIRDAHEAVRERVRSGVVRSAHDIAEGGIAVALAECCVAGGFRRVGALAGRARSVRRGAGRGFIVSGPRDALAGLDMSSARSAASALTIDGLLDVAVSELREICASAGWPDRV